MGITFISMGIIFPPVRLLQERHRRLKRSQKAKQPTTKAEIKPTI